MQKIRKFHRSVFYFTLTLIGAYKRHVYELMRCHFSRKFPTFNGHTKVVYGNNLFVFFFCFVFFVYFFTQPDRRMGGGGGGAQTGFTGA